jgi:membrane peptidoglycan carboxypeptidase
VDGGIHAGLAAAMWLGKAVPGPIRDDRGRPIEGGTIPARLWRDFVRASLRGRPRTSLPEPAHVGRADVGDAGRSHSAGSPDEAANRTPPDPGYAPVVHTAHHGSAGLLRHAAAAGPPAPTHAVRADLRGPRRRARAWRPMVTRCR